MLKRIICLLFAITACCVGVAAAELKQVHPVIVLGNYPADNYTPADPQTARCLKAYELYTSGKADMIVVAGGFTRAHISEARMMKIALTAYGVPESAIVEEDRSSTTVENSIFAKELFKEKGWEQRAYLVSQSYHLPRAKVVFQNDGFDVKNVVAATASRKSDFENMPYDKIDPPPGFSSGTVIIFEPYDSTNAENYPPPSLAKRLRAAAALRRKGMALKLVVMSDWYTRGPVDIAEMMYVALVSLGVPPADIAMKNNIHYSNIETLESAIPKDAPSLILTSPSIKGKIEAKFPNAKVVYLE